MTTDIMELWQQIAAGALPEGVEINAHDPQPSAFTMVIKGCRQAFVTRASTEAWHRYAMLLIVDGWERQKYYVDGWERQQHQFERGVIAGELTWSSYSEDLPFISRHHERETITLGNVLAELGRAVKEGQS